MMWGNPNQWNGQGGGGGEAFGLVTAFGCVAFFTLILILLYLWLFYRIFKKAGYSGWYTLINLVPYVGSIVVLFILAFGDWPALGWRREGPPSGYDRYNQPPYPGGGQSGYTTGQAPQWGPPSSPPPPVYPPEPVVEQPPADSEPPVSP